jgi:exosortase
MDSVGSEGSAAPFKAISSRRVPVMVVLIILLVALAAAYGPVLVGLVQDWIRDPNYSHGFLIPCVSAYLLWRSRRRLKDATLAPSVVGLVGALLAATMLVVGTAGAEVFTQRVSFILLLASLVLFLYGRRHFRAVAFPIAFLLLAVPLPYVIYYGLTAPMQAFAAKCAVVGLKGVGVPALAQGNIIRLPRGSLEVAEACSGIRSLYAFLAVGALVAYATSIPLWGRLLVFLMTIPLAVAGNAARVWGSGMGAYLIGPQATRGTTHELFGLVVFAVCLGVFLLLRKATKSLWSSGASSPSWLSLSREPMPRDSAPISPPAERRPRSSDSRED